MEAHERDYSGGPWLLAALLTPGGATTPPWTAAPEPTNAQLFADNLRRFRDAVGRGLPRRSRHGRQSMSAAVLAMIRHPAPRTSLIRRVGPGRTVALVRDRLDRVRAIAHAHGATVNDVLLAAITGGLRGLLLARGEPVDGVVLRALVPVSMHHEPGLPRGNVLGQITAPLPVGVADPAVVLRQIAAATAEQKARVGPRRMPVLRSRALQRVFLAFMAHQRMTTLTVADIPGPRVRLSLGGMPVLEMFPLVPLIGNMALGVGALSYAGTFAIAAVADRAACPDVDVFAEALRRALDALTESAVSVRPGDQHDERPWANVHLDATAPDRAACGCRTRPPSPPAARHRELQRLPPGVDEHEQVVVDERRAVGGDVGVGLPRRGTPRGRGRRGRPSRRRSSGAGRGEPAASRRRPRR